MDTRNSALVVGLYLAGVVIIVLICLGYYRYERPVAAHPMLVELTDGNRPATPMNPPTNRPLSANYHTALVKANQSLRQLQSSLAASRDVLEKQAHTLNQKNAECQALKDELDQTFMLLLKLMSDDSSDDSATRESTKKAQTKVEAELAQLIESLKQSEVVGAEQERQLTQLRADLRQTDLELATAREQSDLELAALLNEKRTFESVATDVVARCGAAAVPILTDRLSDERVEVRRWAAKALGTIGNDAQEATSALRRMLSDPDPVAREEAQRALTAIGEPDVE